MVVGDESYMNLPGVRAAASTRRSNEGQLAAACRTRLPLLTTRKVEVLRQHWEATSRDTTLSVVAFASCLVVVVAHFYLPTYTYVHHPVYH